MLNFNIRSFFCNQTHLESLLELLETNFKVLFISETWLTQNNFEHAQLANFHSHHTFRTNSRSGGISVFTSDLFKSEKIECLCICSENIETCTVCIYVGTTKLFALGVYRPHSGTIDDFTFELNNILSHEILVNSKIVIGGDMNVNLDNFSSESILNYSATLMSFNFYCVIDKPTRFSNDDCVNNPNRSLIDHIWFNVNVPNISGIIHFDATDHRPCFLHFQLNTVPETSKNLKKNRF